jgi:hypothetical protein
MKLARMTVLIATTAAVVLAAGGAPARAAGFEVGMEDERLLLSGDIGGPFAVARWNQLGVDIVRVHAHWWEIAPSAKSTSKPSGFSPSNPNDRKYHWAVTDRAVSTVVSNGEKVMLTITGPGPVWASSSPSKHNGAWSPKASEFGAFATPVANRYGNLVERKTVY